MDRHRHRHRTLPQVRLLSARCLEKNSVAVIWQIVFCIGLALRPSPAWINLRPQPPEKTATRSGQPSHIRGGQGRNRTVDTRIFSPTYWFTQALHKRRSVTLFLLLQGDLLGLPNRLPNLFRYARYRRAECRMQSMGCIRARRTGAERGNGGCRTWGELARREALRTRSGKAYA